MITFLEKVLPFKGKFKAQDRLFTRNSKPIINFLKGFVLLLIGLQMLGFDCRLSFAQVPPGGTIGGLEKTRKGIEKREKLEKKIEKKEEKPEIDEIEEKPVEEKMPALPAVKIFIKEIEVVGAVLFSEEKIREITFSFENKELTLKEIQNIADSITLLYRKKGYITSRAYVPPQKIKEGILKIKMLEGKMGKLKIEGNRHFKSKLFENKITMNKGDVFNYDILRRNLSLINEHPDRIAKAVLQPGEKPGDTDIVLQVEDRFPIHIGFSYDNFASRYIGKNRYSAVLTDNNLSGNDDILTLNFQLAEAGKYNFGSIRYLIPLFGDWEAGLYAAHSESELGEELTKFNVEGEGEIYSLFINKPLVDKENFDLDWHMGFDYKDLRNHLLGLESSYDKMRIAKSSLDFDITDNWGRTLLIYELSFGIPNIMGGLDDVDPKASRVGSGGKFLKHNTNLLRIQPMPFDSYLLWKNQFQISPYILTSTEQFQIGGLNSVRGYPPAEYVGDKGVISSLEWSFPFYFMPKNLKVPFSKETFYNCFRIVAFYDFGWVGLKNAGSGEEENETLQAAGFGFRFNVAQDFSARVEIGYPLGGNEPSDGDEPHIWLEIIQNF